MTRERKGPSLVILPTNSLVSCDPLLYPVHPNGIPSLLKNPPNQTSSKIIITWLLTPLNKESYPSH